MEVRSKSKGNKAQKSQNDIKEEKPKQTKTSGKAANTKINDFFNLGEQKSSTSKTKSTEKTVQTSARNNKREIPFINKSTFEKIDNPKYKVSSHRELLLENEKVKYGKIMEFDAEARRNKEKNKHEELNKNKIRKNFNLPNLDHPKKTKGKKETEYNFISQSEIEKKQKQEKMEIDHVDKIEIHSVVVDKDKKKEAQQTKNRKKAEKEVKKIEKKEEKYQENDDSLPVKKLELEKIPFEDPIETVKSIEENKEQDLENLIQNVEINNSKNSKENPEKKKEKKKPATKPSKQKIFLDNIVEFNYEPIISVDDLKKKAKLENSDFMLLIIEISQNALKYNLKKSNKSKLFWEEVFLNPNFAELLNQFKGETLRKYWRIISDTQQIKSFIEVINKYANTINNNSIKLLTIINGISDTLRGKLASFDVYLKTFSDAQTYRENFYSSHNVDPQLLNKKMKRSESVENQEIKETQEPIKKEDSFFNDYVEIAKKELDYSNIKEPMQTPRKEYLNTSEKIFYSTPKKSNPENVYYFNRDDTRYCNSNQKIKKITNLSDNDKTLFNNIDEIIGDFLKNFSHISKEQIYESLKKNSFNLEDAYLQLSNPLEFEDLGFTDIDDYILIHMKNTEYYTKLVSFKGKENIEERKAFLNLYD